MPKTMALLAIALSRQLPHGLTVDVVETELKDRILTEAQLNVLGKQLFEGGDSFKVRIWDDGKRAHVQHTLATGEIEDLQVFVFHTQTLEPPTIQ
jgi:hypothetical protein